ncbi:MAG: hypothetical protein ACOY3H_07320 [Bacillota bacterium]
MKLISRWLCLFLLLLLALPGPALAKTTRKITDRKPPVLSWLQKPNPPLVSGGNWPLRFRFNEKSRIWLAVYNSKGKAVVRPIQGRWSQPGPIGVNISLKNWPAGNYTLWITALDQYGNRSRWKMTVKIAARPANSSPPAVSPGNSGRQTPGSSSTGRGSSSSGAGGNSNGGSISTGGSTPPGTNNPVPPSPPASPPVITPPPGSSQSDPVNNLPADELARLYTVPRVDEVKNSAIPGYAIRFYLAEPSYVSIRIYNSQQQVVAVIYDRPTEPMPDGLNTVVWDKKVTLEPGRTDWATPGIYTWEVIVKKGDGTLVNRFSGEIQVK